MKKLMFMGLLVVSASPAFAANPIDLGADDARMLTKVLKLIGAPSRIANAGITQYVIGQTDCTSRQIDVDGMPSYSCTSETVVSRLTEELSATVLFETLVESGVQSQTSAAGDLMSVKSITCSVDAVGESSCVIDPAVDPAPPTTTTTTSTDDGGAVG